MPDVGPIQAGVAVDINITVMSVHVVAYRLWTAHPGGTWQMVCEGHTADNQPDHCSLAVSPGDFIAYWAGVGGRPNTRYQALITVGQNGRMVGNGSIPITGQTDDTGIDETQDQIRLL